jgi:hypothetical protein
MRSFPGKSVCGLGALMPPAMPATHATGAYTEKVPAAQFVHVVVARVIVLYVPAAHDVHAEAPTPALYAPTAHAEQ